MSQFLAEFGKMLAGAEQDAPPSRAWDRLLPKICNRIAGARPYIAALWIADDDTGCSYTLWNRIDSTNPCDKPPHCVSINATGKNDAAFAEAITEARANWVPPEWSQWETCLSYPLVYRPPTNQNVKNPKSPQYLGLISLVIEGEPSISSASREEDISIAIYIATAWLRLNREARVTRALEDLRETRDQASDPGTLADFVCRYMHDHANGLRMCALYVPDGDGLVRLSGLPIGGAWQGIPLAVHVSESPVSEFHFGIGPGKAQNEQSGGGDIWLMRYEFGILTESNHSALSPTLSEITGLKNSERPLSVLLYRVRDRGSILRIHGQPPAIATLVMVCEPYFALGRDSVGGTFTHTHRRALEHGLDFFRYSYALLLQRERMLQIQNALATISNRVADVMHEESDWEHLVQFAELSRSAIPAATAAVILSERDVNGVRQLRWYDRRNDPALPPDWIANETIRQLRPDTELYLSDGNFAICRDVRKSDAEGPGFRIVLLIRSHRLSRVENHLMQQIVAETGAELNRRLLRPQWTLQLAEVRHNLRSAVHSLHGKVEKLSALYASVQRANPSAEVVKARLLHQPGFRKSMSQLEYASNELQVLTEDIRTLSGGGTHQPLQLAQINLPEILKNSIGVFSEELLQRRLVIEFSVGANPELETVNADRHWVQIIIFNLIENAVKYSRRNTVISIGLRKEGLFWRLEVANKGRHIPLYLRKQIFEPYFRVPPEPGEQVMPGTGLGLTSVAATVKMHQIPGLRPPGDEVITVSSEADTGKSDDGILYATNIFRVYIPLNVKDTQ